MIEKQEDTLQPLISTRGPTSQIQDYNFFVGSFANINELIYYYTATLTFAISLTCLGSSNQC